MTYKSWSATKHKIIIELFQSLFIRYQIGLETLMKCSDFVFDSMDGLYYKYLRTILNQGGSYIKSPAWMKDKRAMLSPKYNDKCFQYTITDASNYEIILKNPQRISKVKPL